MSISTLGIILVGGLFCAGISYIIQDLYYTYKELSEEEDDEDDEDDYEEFEL